MKKKVIVLGAGLVGKAIAADLAATYDVTSADKSEKALAALSGYPINTVKADLGDQQVLKKLLEPFDLVVGAVPGFMGFQTAHAVIEAGKNMVDISFFAEDPFQLHDLALANNVTIVTDCGVAPGMGNIILGYHNSTMNVSDYECLVGGLPVVREWPYEYKAVFSPIDVIEEYTRPARFVLNGALVVREALSDPELVTFEKVGTLESWNSDGLRTLIRTMPHIPNMIEKTLRYPGCLEHLRALRDTGFFSHETIEVNGMHIRPIDVTARLLFPKWELKPGEEEFTVMRIRITGDEQGQKKTYEYTLFDKTDTKTNILSMARTTGYTCTAVANLLLEGKFTQKGIVPPEYLGAEAQHFNDILQYLADRHVNYQRRSYPASR